MKKILFVVQSLKIGGAEKAQVMVANKLVELGYDVTILVWVPLFDYQKDLDERVHLIYKAQDEHLGNHIPYIRHKFYDESMWAVRATPRQFYRYYVGHKKYDIEVAFFHSWAVKIISGSTNKKALHIAWVHHDFQELKEAQPDDWKEYIEMYSHFEKIVCVSQAAKESFIKVIGDTGNLSVIYNLLPKERIRQQALETPLFQMKKGKLHLVLVGRFIRTKGYERLIRSVIRLHGEGKEVSLSLVGAGDERENIDRLIAENAAEDYIGVIEGQTNPYPYIKASDLLVCASYTEGYNLTVAEALILGVPVLSVACTGPMEILDGGKYGMIVENSEEGLYEGIKRFYDDPALLAEYREKGKQRVDFFDEDRIVKQITDLF